MIKEKILKNGSRYRINVESGEEFFYDKEGRYHRLDGPAYKTRFSEYWYKHGKMHRLNGPAVINLYNNEETWYVNNIYLFQFQIKELKQFNSMTTEELIFHFDNDLVKEILKERLGVEDDE